jgi:predicted alpha-1,2-mannosidase
MEGPLPRLRRGAGPTTAVAARNGAGLVSVEPLVVEVAPGDSVRRYEVETYAEPRPVGATDELRWAVFPECAGEGESRWDSTFVAIDLELEDGTWLSDTGATDQYGGATTPAEQGAAKRLWVDQWNARRVSLAPIAGRSVRRVVAVVQSSDHAALRVFLDDVDIASAPPRSTSPLDLVSTTRGTHSSDRFSRGNTAPLVGLPHGGVFGLPMTDASRANWAYSWHGHNRPSDNRPTIQAFATSHLPSPWMGDRGVFQVMPSPVPDPHDVSREGRALGFDHAGEEDGPHRYAVRLDGGVSAEMVPGEFALGWRFRFPSGRGSVILDHHGTVTDVSWAREGDLTVVEALLDDRAGTPPHHIHLRVGGVVGEHLSDTDGLLRGYLTVEPGLHRHIDVLLGISTVSSEQARENLTAAGDFDTMAHLARTLWEERLATLEVEGATHDQLVGIYSGLYRTFLYPNRYSESAGREQPACRSPYDPALRTGTPAPHGPVLGTGPMATTHGFWDTYRTAWPLLALLTPGAAGELAQGFVGHFTDGGWTPRWSAPGAEDCMTGTTLDTVLADLALRGVPGLDLDTAYASVVRNATVPATDPRVGRKGIRPAIFRGYVDTATPEGMSWTLDNAINDWAAAQLAAVLLAADPDPDRVESLRAEREYFARRSLTYRNVFDRDRGFFIGRTPDGEWRVGADFDPDEWGHDYTETNAWGTAFTAPHDGRGVAELHGGEEELARALDTFFARPETGDASKSGSYGFAIHEMTEARDVRMGMLGLSNQPAHHIPFMYMFAGRHDDAHRIVREAIDRLFVGSDIGQGYPGDEDNGEMSAWYVFATIGLYPLGPGSGSYVLVPPSVRRTVIRPPGGRESVVEVVGECRGPYVRSVRVNGAPWEQVGLPHDLLASGVHLEFELSGTPCGWASSSRPVSASRLHGFADVPADATGSGGEVDSSVLGADLLFDDLGSAAVRLSRGDVVEFSFDEPVSVGLYTVTAATPGAIGWRLDYLNPARGVVGTDERPAEDFTWPGQTRPFRVRRGKPLTAASVRLTVLTDCELSQVEYVPEDGGAHPAQATPRHTEARGRGTSMKGSHAR